MKGEWCYFKSYFSKDYCEKLIQDALTIEPIQGKTFVSTGDSQDITPNIRKSLVRFIHSSDSRFTDLFDVLWKTQIVANRDFFNVHVTKLDFVQFAEYHEKDQGMYNDHHDVQWINDNENHRKLSCTIALSDPSSYVGGDFQFADTSTHPLGEDMRLQGTMLYFPSFFKHRVTPVVRGVRYSIAAWFEGPKWR
jgi:PKHD-type hydroxylase